MHIVIVTNGEIENIRTLDKHIFESDFVICVDGATRYLKEIDMVPNLLVGDLDSISLDDMEWVKSKGVKLRKFPKEKDKTDTELAIDFALEHSPTMITLIGAIGSRVDHSMGNIFLLKKILDENILGRIVGENLEIYLTEDNLSIEGELGDILSLIPLSKSVEGVTIDGLIYPLNDAELSLGSTWGISNEFERPIANISIKKGLLLVIKSRE